MMFAYDDEPCDVWEDFIRPQLCEKRLIEVCWDILRNRGRTKYNAIYDAIYELIEADIDDEKLNEVKE